LELNDRLYARDAQDGQPPGRCSSTAPSSEGGHDHDPHHPAGELFRDRGHVPDPLPEGERCQREVRSPKGKQIAPKGSPIKHCDDPADGHPPPGGDLQVLEQEARRVGADAEKAAWPKETCPVNPPGGSSRADHDPQEEQDHQVEEVVALHGQGEQGEERQKDQW